MDRVTVWNGAMVPRRLAVASSLVAFSLLGDSMLYAVLPSEGMRLGLAASAIGWVLSLNRWVRLLTNPIAARICALIGWRWPFLGALVLGGATTVTYGIVGGSLWPLLIARLLWGFSWSFLRQGGYSAVLDVSTTESRGRAMGFFTGIFRIGSLLGMLAGGFLADWIGYETTLIAFGLITASGVLFAGFDNWFAGADRPSAPPAGTAATRIFGPRQFLSSFPWVSLSTCSFWIHFTTSGLVTATLGYHLRGLFADSPVATLTGILLSIRWIGGLVFNPLMGILSDRLGRSRVLIMGVSLGAVGLITIATVSDFYLVALGVTAIWVAETAVNISIDAAAGDLAARGGGAEALGYYATMLDLGAASGPLLGYYLIEAGVSLPLVYLVAAAAFTLTPVMYKLSRRQV